MPTKARATPKLTTVAADTRATSTPPTRSANDLLTIAGDTIFARGQERDTLGEGAKEERSMAATVKAFNAIHGTQLTERQGWMFMVLLKAVRAHTANINGEAKPDDYVDGVAYFALAGESVGFDGGTPK